MIRIEIVLARSRTDLLANLLGVAEVPRSAVEVRVAMNPYGARAAVDAAAIDVALLAIFAMVRALVRDARHRDPVARLEGAIGVG
jgi:hypothetical protein